jgi:hypothetical protein
MRVRWSLHVSIPELPWPGRASAKVKANDDIQVVVTAGDILEGDD